MTYDFRGRLRATALPATTHRRSVQGLVTLTVVPEGARSSVRIEHRPSKPGVAGSSPAGRASPLRALAPSASFREAPPLASLVPSGSESCRARQPAARAGSVRRFSGSAATRFARRERFRVLPGAPAFAPLQVLVALQLRSLSRSIVVLSRQPRSRAPCDTGVTRRQAFWPPTTTFRVRRFQLTSNPLRSDRVRQAIRAKHYSRRSSVV